MVRALSLLILLLSACGTRHCSFSYVVDASLKPAQAELIGYNGGPPRPVGLAVGPDGARDEFVANEVIFRPESAAALDAFLAKYNGTVLSDGQPVIEDLPPPPPATPPAWYLIRIDPNHSSLDDIAASMQQSGIKGRYRFSSQEAVRLTALVAREHAQHVQVGFNFVMHGHDYIVEKTISEHPDGAGGFVNAASFGYMTDELDLSKGRLGIGVVKAWDYLAYKGIPVGKTWTRPIVAILDGGFDLSQMTGQPRDGNLDYEMNKKPLQYNMADNILVSVGGSNPNICSGNVGCPWHGTEVFSTAAAYPRNGFGAAGTGGDIVRPFLIKVVTTSYDVGSAVKVAAQSGANVINMSFGYGCAGEMCGQFADPTWTHLQENINFAKTEKNVIVVASAGNASEKDDHPYDNVPCTLDNVICVGAIDQFGQLETFIGNNLSGSGLRVAIYAPDGIWTTPNPTTNAKAAGTNALTRVFGTSISAPFVAGVIGLMKALNPKLKYEDVVSILQQTALKSGDARIKPGYINAFAAVQQADPNQAPVIQIIAPKDGDSVVWGTKVSLTSTVSDPEQDPKIRAMVIKWTSDQDGDLCEGVVCDAKPLSFNVNAKTITLTATDPYGAITRQSITLHTISKQPTAAITFPATGSSFFASQQINLRGTGFSPSESIPDAKLTWSSSLSGTLTNGHDVWVSLPVGTNSITLTATDSLGNTGQATININVQAGADVPTARILSPGDAANIDLNQTITLTGSGTDPVDGILPDSSMEWFSDISGPLGRGNNLKVTLPGSTCAPFVHKLTLRVTNKAGRQASHTITISVGSIC